MTSTDVPIASNEKIEVRYLGELQRLEAKPGDLFVLMCPGPLSRDTAERIKATWEASFPDTKVVVLNDGMKLGLVDGAALKQSG